MPLVSRKSQNTTNLFCAGSLDGAPIITQSRRHKACSKIEVSYSAHSQLAFDASLLFTDCERDCDCDLRLARCCAAAVRSHNSGSTRVPGAKKNIFSKVVPGPLGMLKQVFLARFEPVVARFGS